MIPGVDKKKCIMKSIAQKIISLMIYGVFSNNKLPSDDLVALIESIMQTPTETKIKDLQMELEKFYRKKPSKKVVETVAGLYVDEFVDKINITNAVNDFCLVKNIVFVNEVLSYLKERVK